MCECGFIAGVKALHEVCVWNKVIIVAFSATNAVSVSSFFCTRRTPPPPNTFTWIFGWCFLYFISFFSCVCAIICVLIMATSLLRRKFENFDFARKICWFKMYVCEEKILELHGKSKSECESCWKLLKTFGNCWK